MGRVIPAFTQLLDGEGNPLINGWLQFLVAGTNNTDKDTYADNLYQIANTNPLQLDAEGRVPSVFGTGDYRVISYVNDPVAGTPGAMVQMFDPVTAQGTSESSGGAGTVFDTWSTLVTYAIGDLVTRDLNYYRSLIDSNVGQDPLIQEYAWERVNFLGYYNTEIYYEIGDLVYYNDNLWLSLTSLNHGNLPTISPANWRRVATGYIETVSNTDNYVILPSDRDKIIVLTNATTADKTFTLPSVGATLDRLKLAIYNASDYVLTIDAVGSTDIWLDTTGTLDITKGCMVELMYNYALDTWMPFSGNTGPVLGAQNIGTASVPVATLFVDTITATTIGATTITATTANISEGHFGNDESLYFGDADTIQMSYVNASSSFDINVASPASLNLLVDSVVMWTFADSGELYPGASNPLPNLGSATNSVGFLYVDNVSLPDSGQLLLGNSDDLILTFNGVSGSIYAAASLYIGTTVAATLYFQVNSSIVLQFDTSSTCRIFYPNLVLYTATPALVLGEPVRYQIYYSGGINYLESTTANTYFRYGTTNIFGYNSSLDLYFYQHMRLISDKGLYFGSSFQGFITYDTPATSLLFYTASATEIRVGTSNIPRWVFRTDGHLLPFLSETYDIGGVSNMVRSLYVVNILGDGTPMGFGLSAATAFSIDAAYEYFTGVVWQFRIEITYNASARKYRFTGDNF